MRKATLSVVKVHVDGLMQEAQQYRTAHQANGPSTTPFARVGSDSRLRSAVGDLPSDSCAPDGRLWPQEKADLIGRERRRSLVLLPSQIGLAGRGTTSAML